MTAPSGSRPSEQLTQRLKVQFTPSQEQALNARADAVGMTLAGYVRSLVLKDLERSGQLQEATKPLSRKHDSMMQVAELHALAMQVKKLGVNVNQMAKQANSGMVPIKREEVIYLLNQHQLLMANAIATVEKLLK